jgi:hypothetical protein
MNLEQPLAAIRDSLRAAGCEVEIRAEVRTGDTPAAKRQSIIKRPPHILVTTPESLKQPEFLECSDPYIGSDECRPNRSSGEAGQSPHIEISPSPHSLSELQ